MSGSCVPAVRADAEPVWETNMYRRILVAVDGSQTSNLALEHALGLAKEQRARLRIVHATCHVPSAVRW
jgi:nucleotide-binding universal stress UspA family protein